jgi:SPP1 family predicted phage head-tail adaptor
MSIGTLRKRLVIESKTRTSDNMGGATVSWATHTTVWGEIKPRSANEAFWAKHLEHRVTHTITIRYLSTITSDMRITFGSRTFHIKGIRNLEEERNRFTVLDCQEGIPA